MDAQQLEQVIRDADRLFFDGQPGKALALIRDTRKKLDERPQPPQPPLTADNATFERGRRAGRVDAVCKLLGLARESRGTDRALRASALASFAKDLEVALLPDLVDARRAA